MHRAESDSHGVGSLNSLVREPEDGNILSKVFVPSRYSCICPYMLYRKLVKELACSD
jgi:hypothetical protein